MFRGLFRAFRGLFRGCLTWLLQGSLLLGSFNLGFSRLGSRGLGIYGSFVGSFTGFRKGSLKGFGGFLCAFLPGSAKVFWDLRFKVWGFRVYGHGSYKV